MVYSFCVFSRPAKNRTILSIKTIWTVEKILMMLNSNQGNEHWDVKMSGNTGWEMESLGACLLAWWGPGGGAALQSYRGIPGSQSCWMGAAKCSGEQWPLHSSAIVSQWAFCHWLSYQQHSGLPRWPSGKNLPANAGDMGLLPDPWSQRGGRDWAHSTQGSFLGGTGLSTQHPRQLSRRD